MTETTLEYADIERVVIAEIAEVLSARFHKHIDFRTQAGWTAETPLGDGGAGMTSTETAACAERVARLFGGAQPLDGDTVGAWSDAVGARLAQAYDKMEFLIANAHGEEVPYGRSVNDLVQDAACAARLFGRRVRVISFVPPNHLTGFVTTVLMPKHMGIPAMDGRAISSGALNDELKSGDLLVATPTMWRYLAHTIQVAPDNVFGLSFGERLPNDLEESLRQAGVSSVKELYGATETGLIGWRNSPIEPFCLFEHWRRGETSADDGAELIRIRADNSEQANTPMDELAWDSDRLFRLLGRRDDAVQVGGYNVHPSRIVRIVEEHDKVDACRIRVNFQRDGVCRLMAQILLLPPHSPSEETMRDIDNWCRRRLRAPERPRLYSFEPSRAFLEQGDRGAGGAGRA